MLGTVTVAGIVVVAALTGFFFWRRRQDQLAAMVEKRRGSARLVSRGELSSGMELIPVAIALTSEHLYYENPDLEADLELARIEEIEYDDELTTGHQVDDTMRVLRVRSHGTAFEFVLPKAEATKWQSELPAKSIGRMAAAAH